MSWVNAWVAYLLAVQRATAAIEDGKVTAERSDPSEYDTIVTTRDAKTIVTFLSHVIHARTKTAHTGEGINVTTEALWAEDGSLPWGLTVQNTYMELHSGSKNVTVMVRNSMAYPKTLREKTPVVRADTITQVPEPPVQTSLTEVLEGVPIHQIPKLTVKQRQKKLFEELDLSRLESWPPELAASS